MTLDKQAKRRSDSENHAASMFAAAATWAIPHVLDVRHPLLFGFHWDADLRAMIVRLQLEVGGRFFTRSIFLNCREFALSDTGATDVVKTLDRARAELIRYAEVGDDVASHLTLRTLISDRP